MINKNSQWNNHGKCETVIFWLIITLTLGFLLYVLFDRNFFNYSTETDTLGGFIPEAKRILAGQPLNLSFHPPLYSFALSAGYLLTGQWLQTGIVISILCAGIVLLATYQTVKHITGILPAAWACIITATSPIFLSYATQATSDLYFYALYSLAIWSSFKSLNTNSSFSWLVSGCLITLTILTRANGIVLLLLAFFPLFTNKNIAPKIKALSLCWLGIFICSGTWVIYALLTDSPLMPASNYKNVAMTYFGTGDRISNESIKSIPSSINGLLDVLTHDPKIFVTTYIKDLYQLLSHNLYTLLTFPFSKLAFSGVLLTIVLCLKNRNLFLYTSIAVAHILLINLKTFEARFYIFTLPLLGIGIGSLLIYILNLLPLNKYSQYFSSAVLTGLISLSLIGAQTQALNWTHRYQDELEELLPIANSLIDSDDIIIARKGVLGFYTNASTAPYPNKNTVPKLRQDICSNHKKVSSNLWLFYGVIEIKKRPQYQELLNISSHTWLEIAGKGNQSKWALYKVSCE